MINIRSIVALVRRSVEPDEPALRRPADEQAAYLSALAEALTAEQVPGQFTPQWHGGGPAVRIDIKTPRHSYSRYHALVFFEGDELRLAAERWRKDIESVPLSGVEQLRRFWRATQVRVEQARGKKAKRDKVRRLKERSAEVQVAELARRLGFAWRLESRHRELRLTVRLDDQHGLVVDLPLRDLQAPLESLEHLLGTVRALYADGLRFKIAQTRHRRRWNEPDEVSSP